VKGKRREATRDEGELGAGRLPPKWLAKQKEAVHRAVSWENNKSRLQSSGPDHESAPKESSFQR